MKKKSLIFIYLILSAACFAQQKHRFTLGKTDFLLDGKPFQIISGEMHPARIPREYWRDRIRMAKAMGCNTIAVYVFWNYQETSPGMFDFTTGNHNIAAFIRLCQQEGMWVLLRPGPYVCAEWDFGGLPAWLLKVPDIRIRCMDARYISAVSKYIRHLAAQLRPLLCTSGGPILMSQIENEYGSYGNDHQYLEKLRELWRKNGVNVPFYTADGASTDMLQAGNISGAAIGLDSGTSDADFEQAKIYDPEVPSFSSETYPGWLTHWKEKWAGKDTADLKKDVTYLLEHHKSFNLYVLHGGTNFGFHAGANAFSPTEYQPDVTSYDYDAPVNEQGQPTHKYFMLRNLIAKYASYQLPPVPKVRGAIRIPPVMLRPFTSIWQQLPRSFRSVQPLPMERFGQNQGLMLYRTVLTGRKSGLLTITEPHDYALIFLDGQFIDTVYRDGGHWSIQLPLSANKKPVLDILVEGMGHINFAQYMIDRKGITERVTLAGMTLMNWQIYPLPMDEPFAGRLRPFHSDRNDKSKGLFFQGSFLLAKTGDTYFDLSRFDKGIVYVNGHNLGRYWNTGPQHRLYCPASWLKKGDNHILVFDFHQTEPREVSGMTELY